MVLSLNTNTKRPISVLPGAIDIQSGTPSCQNAYLPSCTRALGENFSRSLHINRPVTVPKYHYHVTNYHDTSSQRTFVGQRPAGPVELTWSARQDSAYATQYHYYHLAITPLFEFQCHRGSAELEVLHDVYLVATAEKKRPSPSPLLIIICYRRPIHFIAVHGVVKISPGKKTSAPNTGLSYRDKTCQLQRTGS